MNIPDSEGRPLFVMENNDWVATGPISDLNVPPRGRNIEIKSRAQGFWITIRFEDLKEDSTRIAIEERALETERNQLAEQNAIIGQLKSRFPYAQNMPPFMVGDEVSARREAWEPIQRVISEWPA